MLSHNLSAIIYYSRQSLSHVLELSIVGSLNFLRRDRPEYYFIVISLYCLKVFGLKKQESLKSRYLIRID